MALYRVMIPYREAASGAPVRYATLEVEADSEAAAKRLAASEFEEMSVFGPSGESPQVVVRREEGGVRVERAPAARRATFEVTVTGMGPQVASIRLTGSLNSRNYQKLQEKLDDLKEQGVRRLVFDMSGLTYVNSTGLSLFIAAGDMFDLRLAAVPARIANLLKMIGLDQLFPTFAAVGEAASAPPQKTIPGA